MTKSASTRLDTPVYKLLAIHAEKQGKNVSGLLRELIERELKEEKPSRALLQICAAIIREIRESRKDIAVATEVLLVSIGNVPKETARSWVENNLFRGN